MRRPVLLAALVALALPAAGAAATTTFLVYSDAGGSLYLANDQGAGAKTLFTGSSSATMEALDVAPDGTQVLALEAADTQQVVQVPAAAGSPKAVAGAAGATFASYSPDGARIVFSVDEYSTTSLSPGVYTIALAGGTPKLVSATPVGGIDSLPVYSPEGSRIAFTRDTYDARGTETVTLELVPAGGGTPAALTTGLVPDLPGGGRLSFSPDGTRIAYAGDYEHPGIYTVATGGGTPAQLTSDFDYWPSFAADGAKLYFSRDATSANADDEATKPQAAPADEDLYELWTVRKDGGDAGALAQGDFELLALGRTSAAAGGGGSQSGGSGAASAPAAGSASTGGGTATKSGKTPARRGATAVKLRRHGTRYVVTWKGKAAAWRVTLKIGRRAATARVKGSLHTHAFVLRGASGRASARVVAL